MARAAHPSAALWRLGHGRRGLWGTAGLALLVTLSGCTGMYCQYGPRSGTECYSEEQIGSDLQRQGREDVDYDPRVTLAPPPVSTGQTPNVATARPPNPWRLQRVASGGDAGVPAPKD